MGLALIKNSKYNVATSEFVSIRSGNWNSPDTWKIKGSDGNLYFVPAYPKSGNLVTIKTGHTVTLTANQAADTVVFEGTGFVYNGLFNVTLTSLDSDTSTYLNLLSGKPAFQIQLEYDRAIKQMKIDTVLSGGTGTTWTNLDRIYFLSAHSRNAAYRSLKNPSSSMSDVVAPYYFPWQGVQGNAATMYINTNFNPSTDGVNFTQNNASVGVYSLTNTLGNQISIGARNASANGTIMRFRTPTNNQVQGILNGVVNQTIGAVGSQMSSIQYLTFRRETSSTTTKVDKDGTNIGNSTSTSAAIPSLNLYLCAENSNGTAANFDDKILAFVQLGSGYIDQAKMKSVIDTFRLKCFAYVNRYGSMSNFIMGSQGQSNDSGAGVGTDFDPKYQAVIPNASILYNGTISPLQLGVNNKSYQNGNGGIDVVLAYQLPYLSGKEMFIAKEDWGGTQIAKDEQAATSAGISIATGSKTVTIATGLTIYSAGQFGIIRKDGSNYMTGTISSYNSGTGAFTINCTEVVGSGTFTTGTAGLRDWNATSRNEFCDSYIAKLKVVIDYCVANNKPFRLMDLIIHGEEDGLSTANANAYYANRTVFRKFVYSAIWDYIGTTYPTLTLPNWRTVILETPSNAGVNGDTVRSAEASLVSDVSPYGFLMAKTGLSYALGTMNVDGVHINAAGCTLVGERDASGILALWS